MPNNILEVLAGEAGEDTLSGVMDGFKQGQQTTSNPLELIQKSLASIQEGTAKYSKKAAQAEKKANKYNMIGNILNGVGALANTVNMAYQGIANDRRGLPIGDPAMKIGSSLMDQGQKFQQQNEKYDLATKTDPAQLLAVSQAFQKQETQPLELQKLKATINYMNALGNKANRGDGVGAQKVKNLSSIYNAEMNKLDQKYNLNDFVTLDDLDPDQRLKYEAERDGIIRNFKILSGVPIEDNKQNTGNNQANNAGSINLNNLIYNN